MTPKQQQAFHQSMAEARQAFRQRDWVAAFASLERAHILGQKQVLAHTLSHWWMLKVGWKKKDWIEIRGQLLRLPAALLMSRLWVPEGNTGGANVSAFTSMPVDESLQRLMERP